MHVLVVVGTAILLRLVQRRGLQACSFARSLHRTKQPNLSRPVTLNNLEPNYLCVVINFSSQSQRSRWNVTEK